MSHKTFDGMRLICEYRGHKFFCSAGGSGEYRFRGIWTPYTELRDNQYQARITKKGWFDHIFERFRRRVIDPENNQQVDECVLIHLLIRFPTREAARASIELGGWESLVPTVVDGSTIKTDHTLRSIMPELIRAIHAEYRQRF